MTVVEANFLHHDVTEEVPNCYKERGKFIATPIATPHGEGVHDKVEEGTDHEHVECYQLESLLVLLPTYLVRTCLVT